MSGRRDEVENPHRKKATLLDACMAIDETDLATVHPNGRLTRPELGEEAREEAEGRANHEEGAHRRRLRPQDPGPDHQPSDTESKPCNPSNGPDPTDEGEPRRPLLAVGGLHEEHRPDGAARGRRRAFPRSSWMSCSCFSSGSA